MILHITWQVADGYAGGSRPQHFDVDTQDWMDDIEWIEKSDEERDQFIDERIQEELLNRVSGSLISVDIEQEKE